MSPTPPPSGKKPGAPREPTTQLPLIRVKRIIKVDKDIQKCGNEAATLITRATESFISYLAEQGFNFAKTEGRKTIQYKDLANAVARIDQLEFLSDIIPRTMTYKKALQKKEQGLLAPDSPEHNGSPASERKRSKGGRERQSSAQGGIERYFGGRKSGNGNVGEDDGYGAEDRMEID